MHFLIWPLYFNLNDIIIVSDVTMNYYLAEIESITHWKHVLRISYFGWATGAWETHSAITTSYHDQTREQFLFIPIDKMNMIRELVNDGIKLYPNMDPSQTVQHWAAIYEINHQPPWDNIIKTLNEILPKIKQFPRFCFVPLISERINRIHVMKGHIVSGVNFLTTNVIRSDIIFLHEHILIQ